MICFDVVRIADNAEYKEKDYDRMRGEDAWIGRQVQKNFGTHGTFMGKVTNVDDDAKFPGHRVFQVRYSDGDSEWLGVDDLVDILLAPEEPQHPAKEVICVCILFRVRFCFAFV